MFASEETHLDYLEAPFLARLTSLVAGTGAQAGLNLYGFTEQVFDPATGFPADASPARTGNPSSTGDTYALEAGNQSITVPGSTPSGYTNPGPYVWLRLKGIVNGIPVYEFDAGQTSSSSGTTIQWVKVTSATPSTITIGTNPSVTAYAAVTSTWDATTGSFSDSATAVWFVSANGEIPVATNHYETVSFGTASDTKTVWGRDGYTPTSFSGARFSSASLQSIASGVSTPLSLSGATTDYDTDSYGATLTVPVAGYYRGFFQVLCPSAGSAPYAVELAVTHSGGTIDATIPSGGAHIQVVYEFHLGAGATVQCALTHNAGVSLNFRTEIAVVALMLIPGVVIDPTAHTITGVI